MYLLLYYRKGIVFDLPGTIDRLHQFIEKEEIDPICIFQDWDYEITWLNSEYATIDARTILYDHLNEKINGKN
jgi:hypothetical protein